MIKFTPSSLQEKNLHRLMDEIRKYKPLTRDEQRDLLIRYKNGDQVAREKLLLHNMPFIITQSKKIMSDRVNINDLINEGVIGFLKGIDRFDVTREDIKVFSYARWWMVKNLLEYQYNQTIVRAPQNRTYARYKIQEIRDRLYTNSGYWPSTEQVMEEAMKSEHFSDETIKDAVIEIENMVHIHSEIDEDFEQSEIDYHKSFFWEDCQSRLDPIESKVIEMMFGFSGDEMKKTKVAEELNLSVKDLKDIYDSAIDKLRDEFS